MFKKITRTVWILSLVSLFTDTASEMLYPVMPVYLQSIGFSVLLIGILEGIAEATAGLSKGYFGKLSDATGKRVPFVQAGYALSALSKPLMVAFVYPLWLFFARTLDRFGKGIRTGARDALLSNEATQSTKGEIFGFHRAMDTMGAVLGPLFALWYLYLYPGHYVNLFLFAFFPGLVAVLASMLLRESTKATSSSITPVSFLSFLKYWKQSPAAYRKLIVGLLVFTLFNSSDVFLLLKVKQAGFDDTVVIGIYIFYNLIYALFAFPLGRIADRFGLKTVFVFGLALFAIVYTGMALSTAIWQFVLLFFLYGVFAASTEGISKAWISNITDKKDTATAIGTFTAFQSICAIVASSLTGLLWLWFGAMPAFLVIAAVTLGVVVYFIRIPRPEISTQG